MIALKRLFPNRVYGRVFDICQTTQSKFALTAFRHYMLFIDPCSVKSRYNIAMTVAIGKDLDSIVVADDATALGPSSSFPLYFFIYFFYILCRVYSVSQRAARGLSDLHSLVKHQVEAHRRFPSQPWAPRRPHH